MMFGIHDLALFIAAGVLLNMTPGPDTFLIVTRASTLGARAGFAVLAGVFCGCFVHILAAAIGLSAILVASSTAFAAIKFIGAAYLIWVGLQLLLAPPSAAGASAPETVGAVLGPRRLFVEGFLCNALNPKVAVFFLAFLPQFVTPGSGREAWGFALLGLIFNLTGLAWNSGTALMAARFRAWLRRPAAALGINRVAGLCFVGFGARLATSGK